MNRVGLWLVTAIVCVPILGLALRSFLIARFQAHQAESTLVQVRSQTTELARLQQTTASLPTAEHRASELSPILSGILANQGIPSQALASFSTGGSSSVGPESTVARERATLMLNSITLPQLGRVLQAWREAEPCWAVTSIELTPMTPTSQDRTGSAASAGGDSPISASLTLEAMVEAARNQRSTRRPTESNP